MSRHAPAAKTALVPGSTLSAPHDRGAEGQAAFFKEFLHKASRKPCTAAQNRRHQCERLFHSDEAANPQPPDRTIGGSTGGVPALCRSSQTAPRAAVNPAADPSDTRNGATAGPGQKREPIGSKRRPIRRMKRRHTCPTRQAVRMRSRKSCRGLLRSQPACAASSWNGKGGRAAGANLPGSPTGSFAISAIRRATWERKPTSRSGRRDDELLVPRSAPDE